MGHRVCLLILNYKRKEIMQQTQKTSYAYTSYLCLYCQLLLISDNIVGSVLDHNGVVYMYINLHLIN